MFFKNNLMKACLVVCIAAPTTGLAIEPETLEKIAHGPLLMALGYLGTYQKGSPKNVLSEMQKSINNAVGLNGVACTVAVVAKGDYKTPEQIVFVASAALADTFLEKALSNTDIGKKLKGDPYYSRTILKAITSFGAGFLSTKFFFKDSNKDS